MQSKFQKLLYFYVYQKRQELKIDESRNIRQNISKTQDSGKVILSYSIYSGSKVG